MKKDPVKAIIYIKDINEVYTIFLKGVKENQLFSDFNLEKLDLEIPVKYININTERTYICQALLIIYAGAVT